MNVFPVLSVMIQFQRYFKHGNVCSEVYLNNDATLCLHDLRYHDPNVVPSEN